MNTIEIPMSKQAIVMYNGSLWQYDYGVQLKITGLVGLNPATPVHFAIANSKDAEVRTGSYSDGVLTVTIPNAMTEQPREFWAYVFNIDGESGKTERGIKFAPAPRGKPTGIVTPDEQSAFDDLVDEFNQIITDADLAGLRNEVETARGTYGTVEERLDDVDADLYTHTGDIAALGGRLTTAEQSIGTLDSGLTGALQRITDNEEDISALETDKVDKTSQATKDNAQDIRITDNEEDISGMQDDISTLQETTLIQTADIAAIKQQTVTKYGVRFGGSANEGETVARLFNAVGLVANVGTDTVTATNDFDDIYPWSGRRRCCGNFDESGNFIVNAYKGEPGYAEDGSNGEVWVELPLFYYKHTYGADDSEEIIISAFPIGGYLPAPVFINKDGTVKQKAYVAAYPMATVDGKATSKKRGVF